MTTKHAIKYAIDAILFIDICAIAAIGLLLAYVIPEGQGIRAGKYFLGLHRHDWGHIHLNLSLGLLALLTLHLWYNWTWIRQSTKRYFGERWKAVLWGLAGAWLLVLVVARLFA